MGFARIGGICLLFILASTFVELTEASFLQWLGFTLAEPETEAIGITGQERNAYPPRLGSPASAFDADSAAIVASSGGSRGRRLLEQVHADGPQQSCWRSAYAHLASSCREILSNETKKTYLAVRFTNCFLRASGRATVQCTDGMTSEQCTGLMSDHEHSVYLAFFLDAATECHYLQAESFKNEMESAVNTLKTSAHWLEEELGDMAGQSDLILHATSQALTAQREFAEQQEAAQALVLGGLAHLGRAAEETEGALMHLQRQVAASHAKQAAKLDAKFGMLTRHTLEIGAGVNASLAGQELLLAGQREAGAELARLHARQVAALDRQRAAVSELAREAADHHSSSAKWHSEIESSQGRLADGSAAMLQMQVLSPPSLPPSIHPSLHPSLQAVFAYLPLTPDHPESLPAALFGRLDRLFALYGAILTETRALRGALFYAAALALVFVFTSVPRTQAGRLPLITATCASFAIEVALIHSAGAAIDAVDLARWLSQIRAALGVAGPLLLLFFGATYRWGVGACKL
eukprot:jgi/Mesen1/1009/ME000120S00156